MLTEIQTVENTRRQPIKRRKKGARKMTEQRKRILAVLLISNAAIVLISVVYVLLFVPEQGDGFGAPAVLECSFKRLFGLYCPGCGGSRSVYYLLTLDLLRSFIFCPAVPITAVIIFALDVRGVICFAKDDLAPMKSFKSTTFLVIPAALLLNFLVRNILLLCGIDYIGDLGSRAAMLVSRSIFV